MTDTHGNIAALDAVSADLTLHHPDLAVLGPRPAAVIDRIRELGWPGVVGNTDEMLWTPAALGEQERRAPKLHALFAILAPWAREHLGAERSAWLRTLPREWRHHELLVRDSGLKHLDLCLAAMP